MIFLGAADTVEAAGKVAETCDLYSAKYLAWVDNSRGNLDAELVERAARVSAADGRTPLVFAAGGVLGSAQRQADALGVAIICFDAVGGLIAGGSELGYRLCAAGLG